MRFAFLPLSISLVVGASATAFAQSGERASSGDLESSRARARQLFEMGGVAFDARRLEEARVALAESFELHPSYDTAGLLGQTEIELGLYPKCARRVGPLSCSGSRTKHEQRQDDANPQIGNSYFNTHGGILHGKRGEAGGRRPLTVNTEKTRP